MIRARATGVVAVAAIVAWGVASGGGPVLQTAGSGSSTAVLAAEQDLATRIDEILDDPRYDGSRVGVVVRSAETGELLYARDSDSRMLPASNAKLFTSAAAMDLLGPNYRFHTTVLSDGDRAGNTLRGDLFLRGGGDPTLLAADYRRLAERLADSGINRVRGDLVADDGFFDDQLLGSDWAWDDEPFYYAAPVSALTVAPNTDYDAGTVIIEGRPGPQAGAPARLRVVPATSEVRVVNDVVTKPAGEGTSYSVERRHGSNVIVVSGQIALEEGPFQDWSSVEDPTAYAADVFRRALRGHGIELTGRIKNGGTPAEADRLAGLRSMTVGKLLTPFLKLSNNGHAEVLVRTIGHELAGEGSWSAGLDAIAEQLPDYEVDPDVLAMYDGSGLSRRDNIPPEQIANLLVAVQDESWFDTWYDALPIAGNPDRFVGGTLASRMVDTAAANNLHAKTGSLTGVSALSGYVTDADDELLVFSIVSNNYLASTVRDVEDAIGVTLAEWSRDATVRADTPEVLPAGPEPDVRGDVECSWVKAC
jgi:serine-type D-Ala-D-Ala carboxypeptidase/endopeptidase (penicillin-binding protein 4)